MTQRRLPDLVGGGKTVPCLAAALMAGAGLVGGCALQPTYVQPAAPVAATFPAGDAYKPAASAKAPPALAAATAAKAADIGWRDVLTDRRLQRLVEIGLANNRDLRVAALNVAQVQAQYRIQRATLFPQRSEEHTSELQSLTNLVCRLLLEKKKDTQNHLLV